MLQLFHNLTDKLNNQYKLYMPGSGSFFLTNSRFNPKGYSVNNIKYAGTS
jgi:hypothetical protein